jgi:hypothetical protein
MPFADFATGIIPQRVAGIAFALAWAGLAATPAGANTVVDWNQQLIGIIQQTSALLINGPPEVAREMSILDSSMFDAVNAASGLRYGTVAYSGGAVSGASADAAALAAGYTALQAVFGNTVWANPAGGSASIQSSMLSRIDSAFVAGLNSLGIAQSGPVPNLSSCIGSISAACSGLSLGVAAGNANLAASGYTIGNNAAGATDGSSAAMLDGLNHNAPAGSGSTPGVYVPPAGRPEMYPLWGSVTPVGITPAQLTAAEGTVSGPPPLGSQAYSRALLETQCSGSGTALPAAVLSVCAAAGFSPETTAQATAALFWNDPGTTSQPPGHWLQITDTVAESQGLSLLQTARLSALVSQSQLDAGIAAWGVKYQDNLWRPITAIRNCQSGTAGTAGDPTAGQVAWNSNFTTCDTSWTSLIATPPHPDYVAGHPAFSGAAATVLDNFFGTDSIAFSSTSDMYCNGGSTWRSASTGLIVACTVPGTNGQFAYNGTDTIFSTPAGCADAGGILGAGGTTCTLNGTPYAYNPSASGCNDIVNGGANDSPLICPITENFSGFQDASMGVNGSEFSRIAGGIHTPFAVADALTIGNAIGQAIASNANIPEPGTIVLLSASLIGFSAVRRRLGRMVAAESST